MFIGLVVCMLTVLASARWYRRSESDRKKKEEEEELRQSEAAGNDEAPATEEAVEIELGEIDAGKLGTVEEGTVNHTQRSFVVPPMRPCTRR